jgi:hypothetical protein
MRTIVALGFAALVVSAFGSGTMYADDAPPFESGLQPGEFAPPFDVHDITGPNQGKTLCYR